jgi:hypothetical protein
MPDSDYYRMVKRPEPADYLFILAPEILACLSVSDCLSGFVKSVGNPVALVVFLYPPPGRNAKYDIAVPPADNLTEGFIFSDIAMAGVIGQKRRG